MADDPPADPPAEPDQGDRVDRIESKVDGLASTVAAIAAKILPGHAEAETRVEEHLDRPSTVEAQVKAELAKAERERAERDAAAARDADLTSVKDAVAKLTEKAPEPPVRRATRLLGWGP